MYLPRLIQDKVVDLFQHFPVVAVLGARQVGKSTLVAHLFRGTLDTIVFDPVVDVGNARQDPEFFLQNHPAPVFLDEIQYAPELLGPLKRSVDRLGRSLQDLVGFLSELHAVDVDLFLHQQGMDTTTPSGKALFQMMSVFAEFERAMLKERVQDGLQRARAQGKRLGRPTVGTEIEQRIRALRETGMGIRRVARELGVGVSVVQRVVGQTT